MPLITNTPERIADAPTADHFEVTGINIRYEEGTVTFYWRRSLRQPNDQPPRAVDRGAHTEDHAVLAGLLPDGSKSYFENLKSLAYARMQATGIFPEGTIT
ncbi:MAG: hypothetical protein WD208_03150 [Dehalococcoidia bacterium]